MGFGKEKSPWGKLRKGEAAKLKKIATTGLYGNKSKTVKLPKY